MILHATIGRLLTDEEVQGWKSIKDMRRDLATKALLQGIACTKALAMLEQSFEPQEFRGYLMGEIYPHLERTHTTQVGSGRDYRVQVKVGRKETRLALIKQVIGGWKPEADKAEDCFDFVCEAYCEYRLPDHELTTTREAMEALESLNNASLPPEDHREFEERIEAIVREHHAERLFDAPETFDPWLRKKNLPEGLKRVLAHAKLNQMGANAAVKALTGVRIEQS